MVKKKGQSDFALDTIYNRLAPLGAQYPINLPPYIRDTMVKRQSLSEAYGGSPVATYPTIGSDFLAQHGMDDFMYITIEHNPVGPQVPGAPGLLFECDELECEQAERARIRRVIIRVQVNPALWIYVGQFEIHPAASLTKEEWASQTISVSITCLPK